MFCQNCGKELPNNTEYCTACGAKQDLQQGTPAQTTVNPVGQSNGYSVNSVTSAVKDSGEKAVNAIKNSGNKLVIAIAAVVVLIIGIVLVVSIVSNSGAKGAVNRYIDAINDYDAEDAVECIAKNLFLDEDDFEKEVVDRDDDFDNLKDSDFEIDVEIKGDKDITEREYSDGETYKERYQELCEKEDEYDDQEVQAVKEVRVKITCDYDKDYKDDVERIADRCEDRKRFTCIKIDGDWYVDEELNF